MQKQFPNGTTILKYAIAAAAGAVVTLLVFLALGGTRISPIR